MSIKYANEYNVPLVKKTTPRTFKSIKPGEKFRMKYETKPLWWLTIYIKTIGI